RVEFSPDGMRLVASGISKDTPTATRAMAWVFDAGTGQELVAFPGLPDTSLIGRRLIFSHDGQRLAGWLDSDSSIVRIFDAATGKERLALKGHTERLTTVAFSPDDTLLYSADERGIVKVWDAQRDEGKQRGAIVRSPDGVHEAVYAEAPYALHQSNDPPRPSV